MTFYYNEDLNLCASEDYVEKVVAKENNITIEQSKEMLRNDREVDNWFVCDVCDSIKERGF